MSKIPSQTCPSFIFQTTQFDHKLIRKTTNHLRHWTSSSWEPYTMYVPEGHNRASWLTTMQMTTAHKNGIMHCNCQHENNGKKMPQHNTITTPRRYSDVSITRVQAHKIPDQIHSTSDTEHRHQQTVHQEYTQNATRGSTTVRKIVTTSHNVVEKWNCQQNQTPNFPSPMLAPMKIRGTETTPHDLGFGQNLYPSEPTMNLQTETEKTAGHNHPKQAQMCPPSFIQRTRFLPRFIRTTMCHLRHKTCSSTEPSVCIQTTRNMRRVNKIFCAYPTLSDNTRPNHALDNFNFQ